MNVAGIGEVKTAGGFNAFLYEPISTRLMDTFSMAVHRNEVSGWPAFNTLVRLC